MTPHATGALGANYNESLAWIDYDELNRLNAKWVRGFVNMHIVNTERGPHLRAILDAGTNGFKTILSLKWRYKTTNFPEPGSPEMAHELQRLDGLLRAVWGRVDILVIGNEPFIDSKPDQQGTPLNIFYETMAEAVISFRNAQGPAATSTRLYMGAFNRLDQQDMRTPAAQRLLGYIASKRELDGVDLHLHIPTLDGHKAMLDYALARIRPDQKFLATEFSMIWRWKRHMKDAASQGFISKYGYPPGTKVHQIIDWAIKKPMPCSQWNDFLCSEPWFYEHRNFITNTMRLYRSTGRLEVATYSFAAMRDRKHPFLPTDTPWMLNSIICPSTVLHEKDGKRGETMTWAEDFRRAQIG